MIYEEGWIKFFETGPNREPLYPFLISLSMHLADIFSISYLHIQKFFQLMILLSTQMLALRLLRKFEISNTIIALTILYIGVSPAIVNSTFSLFSEVMTYPFILGILYALTKAWRSILQGAHSLKLVFLGLVTSILFIFITSVKAIFEFLFPVILLPYIFLLLYSLIQKKRKLAVHSVTYILMTFLALSAFLHFFKSINLEYNGNYAFTNRGSWMLYGTIARRLVPMTPPKILAALAMVPGDGICNSLFEEKECYHWTFNKTMDLGVEKMGELSYLGVAPHQIDSQLIESSLQKILDKPWQYAFFHLVEGGRMFFWESTQIGFVTYPVWLNHVFAFFLLKNGLRLVMGGLTITSFFYLLIFIFKNKNLLLSVNHPNAEKLQLCFFQFLIMFTFIQLYSFFCILTRYSFPIIPLYMLGIGFLLQKFATTRVPHQKP
jgi:hypothetical protein